MHEPLMSAWIVSHKHIDGIVNFYSQQYRRARKGFAGANMDPLLIKRYRRTPYSDGREADPFMGRVLVEDLKEGENRQRLGEILLNENYRSIWYRYPKSEGDEPGTIKEIEEANSKGTIDIADDTKTNIGGYRYMPSAYNDCISLGQFFKALQCLDYQSCEHPEWEDSDAKYIIDLMKENVTREMILETGMIAGYKDAKWGL